MTMRRLGRRALSALPLLAAAALTAWVLARIDWGAFVAALDAAPLEAVVAFVVVFVLALLAADAFATVGIYRRHAPGLDFRAFFVARGASYLPSLLNHHVGQAWLTFVLARRYGVDLRRMAGATLLVYASWGGCILLLAAGAVAAAGLPRAWLALPFGLGLGYLGLLAIAPKRLAATRLLGPLFEAGVGGHLRAMALRAPHLLVLFLGTWLPFWLFDVEIPASVALIYVPVIMVAVTLPITPQGLGTRDALAAAFFTSFAPGSTDEARRAAVAATTTTTAVILVLVEVLLALVLMRWLWSGAQPEDGGGAGDGSH